MRRRGGGLTGLISGNGLIIILVVAMIIGTFTIGPLRPQPETPQPEATPAAVKAEPRAPVVYEPVMCALPSGGWIEAGWETFVQDEDVIKKVRCEDDGTLKEIEETTF